MGRSTGYCLKIIACGGTSESVDRDDLDASSENKATPDKRGWSFRKKPSGHRVLNNTIVTETQTPSSDDKKISEPVIINSEPPVNSSESEKTSTNQRTEEFSRVSTSTTNENTTPSKLVTKADDIKSDSSHDESSSIIVIQTAVRKFLGQREYLRLRNVVKLQAVVRGHLVRCHAAGALRCIHAIVKMQALVRVRYSKRLSLEEKAIQSSNMKPHPTYISIEKLLSNRFANQLTESTPRNKQINIKCDPSKQDQTWKWLEKWMSVSVPSPKVKLDETDTKRLTLTTGSTSPETTIPEAEPPKRTPKRVATEPADSDGRKSAFGSRKASNPSFVAAQSKFLELTLTSKTTTEPVVDPAAEPVAQTTSPLVYESLKLGSECGTELSVTSMLDSPDPSESGTTTKPKVLDTELTHSVQDHDVLGTELTHSISILPEPSESEQEQERTPSTRPDKKREKPKSWANSKKSPVSRGSLENLHSNRRNSFGSQTSEIEQEGRDSHSSSSYSVPSYMQVTESARLKALNSSPRLSPQVQGNMKKRHSLPTAGLNGGGRHGSPRLKRSSPQSQPTTKGNDNRGERKWQN